MEEPLYILQQQQQRQQQQQQNEDVEMEDDSFWEDVVAKQESLITQTVPAAIKEDTDMDQLLDTETPRFESLSMRDDPPVSLKRKRVGEDVFTKEAVKQWQGSRIKAWENRYMVSYPTYIPFLFI